MLADLTTGGSKGKRGTRAPPGGPNSFNFMQFLGKFGKIVCRIVCQIRHCWQNEVQDVKLECAKRGNISWWILRSTIWPTYHDCIGNSPERKWYINFILLVWKKPQIDLAKEWPVCLWYISASSIHWNFLNKHGNNCAGRYMSFRLCATQIEASPHRGKRKFSYHGRKIDSMHGFLQ